MRDKARAAKNNNLDIYREMMKGKNEALIRRAIDYIGSLNGDITFSSVSKVTYEIADAKIGEQGLTLPAISTSKIYRPIVEQAQAAKSISNSKKTHGPIVKHSLGDMQMSLHGLRVKNAKLKMDNKILTERLKETSMPIQEIGNIESSLVKQAEEIHSVAKSLVDRLLELELAYIDITTLNLHVFMYDDVLVSSEALKLFYKRELDELQSKISQ